MECRHHREPYLNNTNPGSALFDIEVYDETHGIFPFPSDFRFPLSDNISK